MNIKIFMAYIVYKFVTYFKLAVYAEVGGASAE